MKIRTTLFLLLTLLFSPYNLLAQKTLLLIDHDIKITGTSNLFNWWSIIEKAGLEEQLHKKNPRDLGICVKVNVQELRSSGGFIMNNIMQKALKAKEYPYIYLRIKTFNRVEKIKNYYKIWATGSLNVAETNKQINFNLIAQENNKSQLILMGDFPLKMTEYGITPPVIFNGNIRTDDEIRLRFKFILRSTIPMPASERIDSLISTCFQLKSP